MSRLFNSLARFRSDIRGNIIIEAFIIIPVLTWTFVAFAMAFDAYRQKNLAQRATYTVADIISRERAQVKSNFMLNYLKVFGYVAEVPTAVTGSNGAALPIAMRVTSVMFTEGATEEDDGTISVAWSMSSDTGRLPLHTNTSILTIRDQIPALLDGDNIIVVESRLRWTPSVSAAIAADLLDSSQRPWFTTQTFETIATVRPRFVPRVCAQVNSTTVACDL